MKIRYGFVSNSSSSSFCIIGIHDEINAKKIAQKVGANKRWREDNLGYGVAEHDSGVTFGRYGYEGLSYAGYDAEKLLQTMTIPEACEKVKALFSDLGVEVDHVGLYYGKLSDE